MLFDVSFLRLVEHQNVVNMTVQKGNWLSSNPIASLLIDNLGRRSTSANLKEIFSWLKDGNGRSSIRKRKFQISEGGAWRDWWEIRFCKFLFVHFVFVFVVRYCLSIKFLWGWPVLMRNLLRLQVLQQINK